MAEIVKAKDDAELESKQLRAQVAALLEEKSSLQAAKNQLEADMLAAKTASVSINGDEVAQLKETIRLLELERSSTRNVCQKAIQVLDAKETEQLQREIEKLRAREQHFREANEIFQQKLQLLTEENRRLRGIKQSY